jgi:hypothetical protein
LNGLILLNLLITPYALQYDYILLAPALLWIFSRLPHHTAATQLAAGALILVSFVILLVQSWSYQGYWQLLSIFVVFTLVLIKQNNAIAP